MSKSKRELIEPTPGDKRYVRRNARGQFTSEVDLHRSLSGDDRVNSKITSKPGQGDRGDGHTGGRKPTR
ncbi:hypothetical protein [Hymenobacter crusticola]|uniref:Uncharacterized protein n=1 Tax=Hymenobacter crusticola TaxID=1770526 RepID=A0A243WGJ5_9BACT|nr:hypothetical protein [Hymenobacter crusticola]OUJ74886.1 hypothetical protein BXP70_09065 [Hymenobacter crusticola]